MLGSRLIKKEQFNIQNSTFKIPSFHPPHKKMRLALLKAHYLLFFLGIDL
jgi:hypothetical protein